MTTLINTAASTILARAIVALIWGPVDRAVCRWANLTNR